MPAPTLDVAARDATLAELEARELDCLVIGGGITGAGIAREAARRGLDVGLIEADDFAAGTSSRSSKLIHGGLRYLAQGEIALVRDTALERKQVHRVAPHLAEPGWMIVPVRSRASLLKFRAAITTYEKLGAVDERDLHRSWGADELVREEPALRRDRFPWACVYREYATDDARLVLANLRAASAEGALVANHLAAVALVERAGRVCAVRARCSLSGAEIELRSRCVVNAAGPWVEAVRRLEDAELPPMLHLSKGVHLVFDRWRLPVRNFLVMGTQDKRSIFAIPRGDVVYVGTTDTSYAGGPERWPEILPADVAYLLEPLLRHLDVDALGAADCVAAWAGLRPLLAQPGRAPTEISRRDEIAVGATGVITIAGGKLTGYRKMARDVVTKVGEALGRALPEAVAVEPPLPGGDFAGDLDSLSAALRSQPAAAGLDMAASDRLVRLYGAEAAEVIALGAAPVVAGGRVVEGELVWGVRREGAATLLDLLDRRLRATLYLPAERDALVEPAAAALAAELGWDAVRRDREIDGVRARIAADLVFRDSA